MQMNVAPPSCDTFISTTVWIRSENFHSEDFKNSQEKVQQIANLFQTANEAIARISLRDIETIVNLQKHSKMCCMS